MFEVYGNEKEAFYFRKRIRPNLMIGFNVLLNKGNWSWNFLAWTTGSSSADAEIVLKDNMFYQKDGYNQIENLDELFQAFIGEIKKEPVYRLKILNTLNEDMVKIWNKKTSA